MSQALATASRAKLSTPSSFAATQAAWRFYAHEATTLKKLSEPMLASSTENIARFCQDYALVVHDWSLLNYHQHASKLDRKTPRRHNKRLRTANQLSAER
jgi:hypothetical protein